jgi:hypothetical protein
MKTWQMVSGVVLLSIVSGLAACGSGDGVCGEIYDKRKACWEKEAHDEDEKDEIPSKEEFVAICKARMRSHKEDIDVMAKCSKEGDCEKIEACESEASDAKYQKKKLDEVNKQMAEAKWDDAFDNCRYVSDKPSLEMTAACEKVFTEGIPVILKGPKADSVMSACQYTEELKKTSPAFKKACTDVMTTAYETKKKEALAARDLGADNYSACYDMQSAAAGVSEEAKKEAEGICAELTLATSAKRALDEANANIAAKKGEISYYCTSSADELTKLEPKTEWSKKKLDEVIKTCFLDLGKVTIEATLPGATYCPYVLTQLREYAVTYALAGKDPAFDTALASTDKLCKE